MTKHTIGIYKAYKNSGNLRFHRKGTKKSWKHYFIEIDDYDEDEYLFGSEWVSSLKAVIQNRSKQVEISNPYLPILEMNSIIEYKFL